MQSYLFLVGGDDADVRGSHRFVELLGQLAAVDHDLYSLHWVEPRWVVTFPHFCALGEQQHPDQTRERNLSVTPRRSPHPDSVEEEWEAFFGQGFPLAESLYFGLWCFETQFVFVEELRGQRD